jgi:polysaccharide biosynthesis/export protein
MTRWARILLMVGAILALASEARAQGFVSPFNGDGESHSKQPKASQFSPVQESGAGRAAPASGAHGSGTIPRTDIYRIGPLDVLDISVFGVSELSGTVEVNDSGNVQLPVVGEISAAGKTAEEVQQDLTSRLGAEYLQDPQVRVTVKEFKSRNVTVAGQIANPGIYPLKGKTSLLQVVAMAGGFKEASDSTVLVLRKRGDGKRVAARFDVSAIEKGQTADPIVQPGDNIVAGESSIKGAYQLFLKALPVAGVFALF